MQRNNPKKAMADTILGDVLGSELNKPAVSAVSVESKGLSENGKQHLNKLRKLYENYQNELDRQLKGRYGDLDVRYTPISDADTNNR